jgi:sialidase-1
MANPSPEIQSQESSTVPRKNAIPGWQYAGAIVQIGLAAIILPVFYLFIQLLYDEFTLPEIYLAWVLGIGFIIAVALAVVLNIIFIWRGLTGRVRNEVKEGRRFHLKQIAGAVLHLVVATILLLLGIVVVAVYGGDLFGEAGYLMTGILGITCAFGYSAILYISGIRILLAERRHVPHLKLGAGFLGIGIIILFTLPVAGLSTFFAPCTTVTYPSGITFHTELFAAGDDGYNTYKIPSLAVAPNGTIFAFCEARKYSDADHGDIQIAMRKSYDNGLTWTPMQLLVNAGPTTAGNPCPVVDSKTGTMWMLYCINNLQVYAINSTDNGEHWSNATPMDLTSVATEPSWTWIGTGPGNGIQLASGRLLVPTYHIIGSEEYCGCLYSDNHGATWQQSTYVVGLYEEPQAVQLVNGTVLLSLRPDGTTDLRAESFSYDNGTTWTAARYVPALVSPSCQGSIIRYTNTSSYSKNRIIFSNPADVRRDDLTIRVSYDEGQTWTYSQVLWAGPAGYSDLVITKNMQIGILFDHGLNLCSEYFEHIDFALFNMTWLSGGADNSL